MKKVFASATALALGASLFFSNLLPGSAATIDQRQHRQQVRIVKGVESGKMTTKEALAAEKSLTKTKVEEAKFKASGGVYTPVERAKVQHDLNKSSKKIYRAKHN